MTFDTPLIHGTLIKRYKRFLADVRLDNGEVVMAHCTNSGSMKSCLEEGAEVYLSPAKDPKRKTRFTWEMIKINEQWVGIHTGHPNVITYEAIQQNLIPGLSGYENVQREVKIKDSRLDIMAQNANETCFIEVKNVTMKVGDAALFPDAITTRGRKHLNTLMDLKREGFRTAMVYIIQRMDVSSFGTAADIDPHYDETLRKAIEMGVEVFPMQVRVTPQSISIVKQLPFYT